MNEPLTPWTDDEIEAMRGMPSWERHESVDRWFATLEAAASPRMDTTKLAKARDLVANYLWNEDGEDEDWLAEAHDILRDELQGVPDYDFAASSEAAPQGDEGLRRIVRLMENEGVVTWGDEAHRDRFLAAASQGDEGLDLDLRSQPLVAVDEDGYHDHTGVPCRTCVALALPRPWPRPCGDPAGACVYARPHPGKPHMVPPGHPLAAPSQGDERLRAIVKRTATMGSCSQTHHEHLARDARAALAAEEERA